MERNFYTDEFEEFLKQKADQNKMYPSDRVWNNVYGSLHNRRRWFAIGLVLLLITSALMISREVLHTSQEPIAQKKAAASTPLITPASTDIDETSSLPHNIGIAAFKGATRSHGINAVTIHNRGTDAGAMGAAATDNTTAGAEAMSSMGGVPGNPAALATVPSEPGRLLITNSAPDAVAEASNNEALLKHTAVHPLPAFEPTVAVGKKDKEDAFGAIHIKMPLRDKWSIKIYGGPIVSYRRLSDLSRTTKYVPVAISYSGNIDNYVHHKPALGFEIGTRIQYKLTPSLGVFSGVQLNYSRYYIDAYKYNTERATIALTTSSVTPDTLANYTSLRNFGGYSPAQLQNQYFQLSVPLGAELKLMGNDHVQLNIAAAVQPTYLLASSTYLLSSDFKNYVQDGDLMRRFNLHTNFEAYISYLAPSGLKWQLGPQFRYQVLSSYSNKYPIREYITEFGIKLGITRIFK